MKKILDVGCGDAKVNGAIGMDIAPLEGVDIVHNLTSYPWPFEDETFDEIYMLNIIEHLPNTIQVMEEIYRILKKGGLVHIVTVYWNHRHSISDPQHCTFYNEVTWEFFTGQRKGYYTKAQFEMISFKFTYDPLAKKYFKFEKLMKKLSYFLCNIIDGMHITLKKPL